MSLLSSKSERVGFQINVLPTQTGDIAKSLASVNPEQNGPLPFAVSRREEALQFRHGKFSAGGSPEGRPVLPTLRLPAHHAVAAPTAPVTKLGVDVP